jgi:hypothetical protein
MAMTNKQLKELLNQYPDESTIYIFADNGYGGGTVDISMVTIEYDAGDSYKKPQIIFK